MARYMSPTKGLLVLVNDEKAESTQVIAESLHLSDIQYQAVLRGTGSFTSTISTSDSYPAIRYATPAIGSIDTVTVTGVSLGVGNAALVTFGTTLTALPLIRNSLVITAGGVTGTTSDLGVISGAGITSGSCSAAGVITVTLASAPASLTPVTATYTRGAYSTIDPVTVTNSYIGKGDNTTTVFSKTFTELPIVFNSLKIQAGNVFGNSDVAGNITGYGITSGTINAGGVCSLTFTVAPPTNTVITASFNRGAATGAATGMVTSTTDDTIQVTTSLVAMGDGTTTTYAHTFTEIPILLSSAFTVVTGGVTGTSNGSGVISGAGITSGSITAAGVLNVVFSSAPTNHAPITATFVRTVL